MERTGWPKVMEVDGISLLQVAHMFIVAIQRTDTQYDNDNFWLRVPTGAKRIF